ncbi:MAG: hypothetical protein R3303_03650, partial [Marinobacter sp.]|nr:hypothetical protein [Marinobacter sp.]
GLFTPLAHRRCLFRNVSRLCDPYTGSVDTRPVSLTPDIIPGLPCDADNAYTDAQDAAQALKRFLIVSTLRIACR